MSNRLRKSTVRSVGYGLASLAFIAAIGIVSEDDIITEEDKTQAATGYLDNQGCDGEAFKRGEIQYCPESNE